MPARRCFTMLCATGLAAIGIHSHAQQRLTVPAEVVDRGSVETEATNAPDSSAPEGRAKKPAKPVHCGSACSDGFCQHACRLGCCGVPGCEHCPLLPPHLVHRCRDFFPIRKHIQPGPPPYTALPPKPPTFLPVPTAPVYSAQPVHGYSLIPAVISTAPGAYLHLPVATPQMERP